MLMTVIHDEQVGTGLVAQGCSTVVWGHWGGFQPGAEHSVYTKDFPVIVISTNIFYICFVPQLVLLWPDSRSVPLPKITAGTWPSG